jgi:hypothetical protein
MATPQQLVNVTAGPNEGGYAAAGAYVLPAWLTASASSGAAWVPKPQQGWQASAGRLWAAIGALPIASLVVAIVIAYLVHHVSKTAI